MINTLCSVEKGALEMMHLLAYRKEKRCFKRNYRKNLLEIDDKHYGDGLEMKR